MLCDTSFVPGPSLLLWISSNAPYLRTLWSGDRNPRFYRLIDLNFWRQRVAEANINTRGWVLQERTLAARVLHFCFDQVVWECCELTASENDPDGSPGPLLDGFAKFKHQTKDLQPTRSTINENDADIDNSKLKATLDIWGSACHHVWPV